ncbi:hypothetical protein [Vagococcus bubulae]|uniref:WxL domain-containing protein n=1 Tax=Vagococcus bubulae TaxID=1977868 RepID=A0A429ZEX4_9ENTE|nr:hypothetical protein [Vagococcus bubulae]RST92194.1 hypothetical protein CBF36_08895 [Vagococcus bubulae]
MKKTVLGLLSVTGVLAFTAVGVSADQTGDAVGTRDGSRTYIGEDSATIPVQGTLGVDNTKPDSPIDEGDDAWINVTVPTQTYFYSAGTVANSTITSPKYTIKNNSGRPVVVNLNGLTESADAAQIGGKKISETTEANNVVVNLLATGGVSSTASTKIITNGNPVTPLTSQLGRLANNEGKDKKSDSGNEGTNILTFNYGGTIGTDLGGIFSSNYTLGLTFSVPSDWE